MKTATNKRLLISENHDDSNQYTPCRGKPDQHGTRFSRSVRVWPSTIHISRHPHIAVFREVINSNAQSHCSREKGLLTQSTARQLTNLWVRTQFLSWASHWSSGDKATLCWWQASRLTGPISLACDQYIQYLLAGANPSVLNRHRWGLQPWRYRLSTYHSPTFPTDGLPFPPKDPARSLV
jgi:hypothetical protein